MGLTFCNVHFTKQPQRVVYVSGELMKSLKLTGKKNIRLRLGKMPFRQRSSRSNVPASICSSPLE